jgi:endonuclease YncB( thermonuclease family)
MRKSVLTGLAAGALLLVFGALSLGHYLRPPPPVAADAGPPPDFAARELARATAPVEVKGAPEAVAQAPLPPAVPDLPTIEVAPRPVYPVPEDEPPPPAPKANPFTQVARPTASPEASARPAPAPMIAGAAAVSGATTLAVAGRPIRLFGVRTPDPGDRCGAGSGGRGNCAEAARDALAQRLDRSPQVSCRIPAGQRGNPAAVCVDASGTDLGRFLVAEGLALADTTESYEYFGAEGKARSSRLGLWGHR